MYWLLMVAGFFVLYFGFWFVFLKLVSYLTRRIESKVASFTVGGILWIIAVYLLTGLDFRMAVAILVVQAVITLPHLYQRYRRNHKNIRQDT